MVWTWAGSLLQTVARNTLSAKEVHIQVSHGQQQPCPGTPSTGGRLSACMRARLCRVLTLGIHRFMLHTRRTLLRTY